MSSFLGGIGGAGCPEDFPKQPTVAFVDQGARRVDVATIGALYSLCFLYFTKGETIEWQIRAPDGSSKRRSFCFLCRQDESDPALFSDLQEWGSVPGDPVGTYQIMATQGAIRATTSFTLQHGPQPPLFRVIEHAPGTEPVGTAIHVVLAGFEPRQVVNLLIYHATSGSAEARYITTVPVSTDVHGERLYTLQTALGDPKGCYVLRTQPSINFRELAYDATSTDTFCLR